MEMQSKKMAKPKPGPSTVKYLDIAEIRDDMVIMKDGTVRSVLMISSINFALKSTEEQEAIIQAYMAFLNSLEYSVQVVIQSRKMNIDNYLNDLKESERKMDNELLRSQIADYRSFVNELVVLGEIMQKTFYLVVPYDPISDKKKNFMTRFQEIISPAAAANLNKKQLEDRIEQLRRRVEIIQSELNSMSLESVRLDTQGLIELYYTAYNPDLFGSEKLSDITKVNYEEESTIQE